MKKICFLLAVIMVLSAATYGCSQPTAGEEPKTIENEPVSSDDKNNGDEKSDESNSDKQITDMAGRQVTVPQQIDKAFSTSATGSIALYALEPSLLIGWNYDFNDAEKAYILPEYQSLKSYGQGDQINYEALIAADPDVLIVFGTISDAAVADADSLQAQTGLPVVMVDGSLKNTVSMFEFMGELFDLKDKAAALSQYADKAMQFAEGLEGKGSVRTYFGNGQDSLETAPVGSPHAELFEIVGADNVAVLEEAAAARVSISAEQLIAWDPDIIIVNGEPKTNYSSGAAAGDILDNPDYATLKAVREERVYGIPKYPFAWFDRPPGCNRIIGVMWLASVLYPDQCDYDIKEETKEFYNLYYHTALTDDQLSELLG